jgi:hypothetical protein
MTSYMNNLVYFILPPSDPQKRQEPREWPVGLFSARLLCGEARRYLFLYLGEPENPQTEVIKPPRTAYAKDHEINRLIKKSCRVVYASVLQKK